MADHLFTDASRSGLFHLNAGQRTTLAAAARAADLRLFSVDLADCRTAGGCLQALGKALSFPDWYGANLDALVDCLCDPDWQAASGDIVLLAGMERLRKANRAAADSLLEALATASAECRDAGRPLWILIDRPLSGIPPLLER